MVEGVFRVYKDWEYLGKFNTCVGADALVVDQHNAYNAMKIDVGDILDMDETRGVKAWEVRVTKRVSTNIKILIYFEKISDRPAQYPVPVNPKKKFLGIFG